MSYTSERAGRASAPELLGALAAWTPASWSGDLHPADIGWQLRFEDDALDGTLQLVRDAASGAVVAVGLLDDPATLRLAVDPARSHDSGLAVFLADLAEDVVADGEAYVDGALLAVWRGVLAARGWEGDPDAWVALQRDLTGVATELPPGVAPVAGRSDVADRVAVQRAAFEKTSTFTAERWELMAASPAYDASLDLLVRDEAGTPVAAGTASSAGPGAAACSSRSAPPPSIVAAATPPAAARPLRGARRCRCEQRGGRHAGVQHRGRPGLHPGRLPHAGPDDGYASTGLSRAPASRLSTAASTSSAQPQDSVTPAPPWP